MDRDPRKFNCENAEFVTSAKYTSLENLYKYGIKLVHETITRSILKTKSDETLLHCSVPAIDKTNNQVTMLKYVPLY